MPFAGCVPLSLQLLRGALSGSQVSERSSAGRVQMGFGHTEYVYGMCPPAIIGNKEDVG